MGGGNLQEQRRLPIPNVSFQPVRSEQGLANQGQQHNRHRLRIHHLPTPSHLPRVA